MEDVFENDSDPKPIKEKKVRKKRQVSEATKKRLREQLKKGRATALANRKRKLAEKKSNKKSADIVIDTVKEEPPIKEPVLTKETKVEPPPSPKKEVVVNKPPTPKIKEEPRVVNTPAPVPRIISEPINIPPPLEYQSTFKKMKRKW
jgi:hypothetical protein